jgi:hypothetical protein
MCRDAVAERLVDRQDHGHGYILSVRGDGIVIDRGHSVF